MLSCRFQQFLATSAMFLVQGSSEKELFRHLSNNVFGVFNFRNTKAMSVIFFPKCLKINLYFKNALEIEKKCFVFEKTASELVSLNSFL